MCKELPLGDWFGLDPKRNGFNVSMNVSYIDLQVTLLGSGRLPPTFP